VARRGSTIGNWERSCRLASDSPAPLAVIVHASLISRPGLGRSPPTRSGEVMSSQRCRGTAAASRGPVLPDERRWIDTVSLEQVADSADRVTLVERDRGAVVHRDDHRVVLDAAGEPHARRSAVSLDLGELARHLARRGRICRIGATGPPLIMGSAGRGSRCRPCPCFGGFLRRTGGRPSRSATSWASVNCLRCVDLGSLVAGSLVQGVRPAQDVLHRQVPDLGGGVLQRRPGA
jgi:hypothetical protein